MPAHWRTPDAKAQSAPLVPLALRKGHLTLRFFTTIATLGTPQDITLQELRVKCFFPEATKAFARHLERSETAPEPTRPGARGPGSP